MRNSNTDWLGINMTNLHQQICPDTIEGTTEFINYMIECGAFDVTYPHSLLNNYFDDKTEWYASFHVINKCYIVSYYRYRSTDWFCKI